uniref:Protein kinase domain-containing protein n=1 Tax=Paramoeba aestuarina TaxID=180227 RepID=A0A7S4JTK3_9EUKA|mmetsp:Transcript_12994/g.20000  ORF Transcript_12994/g.20000 Transcript_12994/m.20000 type:complete len:308 (+) Transcript_12994:380-1303(+)|eukprot:CAMPEP_0201511248 /NCGR_PEP_ID=MMETSP0161_2-20130828/3717_1 /ASSEMBLY_ACC=CAM_ASM_000251 /TAXON_ID=180227 /ORGANISM="Neoparamoeba aestuarina, Strain SoJaBio B1-5/56/2" /LENGTH=307 /DNA_ID=CAMNT_0047906653 /DNA_START=122 /DNA_END=1045 /DNA_ORIENTATION=+
MASGEEEIIKEWSSVIPFDERDPSLLFEFVEELGMAHTAKKKDTNETFLIQTYEVNQYLRRVHNEYLAMSKCEHEKIAKFYGSYLKENRIWIVLEYCAEGNVVDLMEDLELEEGLKEEEIKFIIRHVLLGLQYLHTKGTYHGDVKANNILLTDNGEVKLDAVCHRDRNFGDEQGAPYHMAPEVMSVLEYGPAADVWALGITAIELAENYPEIFDLPPLRFLFLFSTRSEPPKLTKSPESFSKEFHDFISKCLVKEKKDRWDVEMLMNHPWLGEKNKNDDDESPLMQTIMKRRWLKMEGGGVKPAKRK